MDLSHRQERRNGRGSEEQEGKEEVEAHTTAQGKREDDPFSRVHRQLLEHSGYVAALGQVMQEHERNELILVLNHLMV